MARVPALGRHLLADSDALAAGDSKLEFLGGYYFLDRVSVLSLAGSRYAAPMVGNCARALIDSDAVARSSLRFRELLPV